LKFGVGGGLRSKVTRPINADTHCAPYLPNGKAYELQTLVRMEDDDPHQLQALSPPRSKVKVARSRDQSEPSWPNAVTLSLEAGGGILCRPTQYAPACLKNKLHVVCAYRTVQKKQYTHFTNMTTLLYTDS